MKYVRVGITGTGSLIGQAIIKSIKNSRFAKYIVMIGFDYFENTVGSHWVKENYILPDILKDNITEEQWIDKVIDVIVKESLNIIFIGLDFELELFAKYKEDIEKSTQCIILVSNRDVIKTANDKYLTYEFLREHNLSHPETLLPEELQTRHISFPCIIKPRIGARSKNVFIVERLEDIEEAIKRVERPIIQELIGDLAHEYTCGVIFFDDLKHIIALRRILKDGNTETAFFYNDIPKIIYTYVTGIAQLLKPYGPCNFQLRLDNQGIPKLFEINPRHSGTTYIRAIFGFKEVEYILAYLFNLEICEFTLREGIVKRYYDEIFIERQVVD